MENLYKKHMFSSVGNVFSENTACMYKYKDKSESVNYERILSRVLLEKDEL